MNLKQIVKGTILGTSLLASALGVYGCAKTNVKGVVVDKYYEGITSPGKATTLDLKYIPFGTNDTLKNTVAADYAFNDWMVDSVNKRINVGDTIEVKLAESDLSNKKFTIIGPSQIITVNSDTLKLMKGGQN